MNTPDLPENPGALPADTTVQLSPLSIQAASLVRSVDALSNIFWISIAGTFLTIFFAGLAGLEANANTDYIFLGEYQVPKSILPLASVVFAMFVFWLMANRLNMLAHVLQTTRLPQVMVHEIFHLNPPVLNVFDKDNVRLWSPFTGVSVLLINWAVFFGNSIALTLSSALQQGASFAEFNFPVLSLFLVLILAVMVYGIRVCVPPLRTILNDLHGLSFHIGWPRMAFGGITTIAVLAFNIGGQFINPSEQADQLIGPDFANAIDGETLFVRGIEVQLFGIDAVETDQVCQDAAGSPYACGQAAVHALQGLIRNEQVVCRPLFGVNANRMVATCDLVFESKVTPGSDRVEPTEENLSRLMVARGHALAIGIGEQFFGAEQSQAQKQRRGIWQGAFTPPATWRSQQNK